MTDDSRARLRMTVHVGTDGTVTHGVPVAHRGANTHSDVRTVASPPRRARVSHFRGHAGVPSDTYIPDRSKPSGWRRSDILSITIPHDCANHLKGV